METQRIRLKDDRNLSYAEYGTPDGVPVILFHGTPGSRLLPDSDINDARQLGIRLIVPDRPGFGFSDFQPDRVFLDWPDDVLELADHLGISKFGVFGVSGGGPFAAACAYKIPQRLTRIALLSSIAPFNALNESPELPEREQIEGYANHFADQIRNHSDEVRHNMTKDVSGPDFEALSIPSLQDFFIETTKEAFRNGAQGYALEAFLFYTQPWGFPLEAIEADIEIWHGELDAEVPLQEGQFLCDRIPNCRLHVISGKGHIIPGAIGEILKTFL